MLNVALRALAGWIEEEDRDRQLLDFIAASKRGNLPLAGFKLDEGLAVRRRLMAPEWAARYGHNAGDLRGWIDLSTDREMRQARQRQLVFVGLAIAALAFAALSVWAWVQKSEAEKARRETVQANEKLATSKRSLERAKCSSSSRPGCSSAPTAT
jgi:hypothetical protein